jgi:two-component system NtrC family sensor kinase
VALIKPATPERIYTMLKREILAVYLIIVFVAIGILMNYRTTQRIVNRIRDTEKAREEAITHSEHSAKLASIGRLATGVAHEINNPLAIINEKAGLIKDLFEMYPESSGCQKEFLPLVNAISESVGRCRTITHRLLGFARRMEISIEPIDVNEVMREVVGFLERELAVRSIRLELNLDESIPQIESDRGLLQQVFLNIANNAIDAVKDGGEIIVSTMSDAEGGLKIVIRDDGAGIPKDVLKHIFEPFFTTKEKGKGTGLGLSLSYGIIQRLGGTIEVDSILHKGTTFTIRLPFKANVEVSGS